MICILARAVDMLPTKVIPDERIQCISKKTRSDADQEMLAAEIQNSGVRRPAE